MIEIGPIISPGRSQTSSSGPPFREQNRPRNVFSASELVSTFVSTVAVVRNSWMTKEAALAPWIWASSIVPAIAERSWYGRSEIRLENTKRSSSSKAGTPSSERVLQPSLPGNLVKRPQSRLPKFFHDVMRNRMFRPGSLRCKWRTTDASCSAWQRCVTARHPRSPNGSFVSHCVLPLLITVRLVPSSTSRSCANSGGTDGWPLRVQLRQARIHYNPLSNECLARPGGRAYSCQSAKDRIGCSAWPAISTAPVLSPMSEELCDLGAAGKSRRSTMTHNIVDQFTVNHTRLVDEVRRWGREMK